MLELLELVTAVIGSIILYDELVKNRFVNFATSIFLLCFVPLFCIYPVIARITVGGAYSVSPRVDMVIDDPAVYVIYQLFCLSILLATIATRPKALTERPLSDWQLKYSTNNLELTFFTAIIAAGVYFYIVSTGLSTSQLFAASRFEWFNDPNYSPLLFVVSSYLIAAAPVGLILSLQNKRFRWAFVAIILLLVFYGLLSKDRKWLISISSALMAFAYFRNGFSIKLRTGPLVLGVIAGMALAFWQVARGVLFSYYLTGVGDLAYDSSQTAITLLTRGDLPYYYNASVTAIDMNLNYDFSIPMAILRRQLLFFVPAKYSLGLKIEDISALFSDAIGGEDAVRRGNMPPGLFGLFAISFGWAGGALVCSLIPVGLRALDRYIHRNRGLGAIVVAAQLLSSATLLLRGDDSSATYFIISSLALFFIVRAMAPTKTRLINQERHL